MTSPELAQPTPAATRRHLVLPYVGPFLVLAALILSGAALSPGPWLQAVKVTLLAASIWWFSRSILDLRVRRLTGSICVGAAVFLIWIAPDLLWPAYRAHWLFTNPITGGPRPLPEAFWDWGFLLLRATQSAVLVPVIEELFWRAWLMRRLLAADWENIPLGAYSPRAFWLTAVLFASEHGRYWDVGLLAGVAYNWWMIRTRSVGDCILAHAVTNAILSAYVIASGQGIYWP